MNIFPVGRRVRPSERITMIKNLVNIQNELKAPKSNFNSFGKYRYRSAEDILTGVKPILSKYGCQMTITDDIVFIGSRFYIKATVTITDGDGNSESVSAYAREDESKKGMDGSQVTGASSSYARKYALNGLFLIDDTKDADTDEFANQQTKETAKEPTRMASPVQMKRLKEFYGERFEDFLKSHKLKSENEVTMALADETIKKITEYERRKG